MSIIPWTEIGQFHNIRDFAKKQPDLFPFPITYAAKVKLHGNNGGIQIHSDGKVVVQGRTTILTPQKDLLGFAAWAHKHEKSFRTIARNTIIFGEWCGPGVQANVAVNKIPNKIFAVFAARTLDSQNGLYDTNALILDPEYLAYLIKDIPDAHVIPWFTPTGLKKHTEVTIDWKDSDDSLDKIVHQINDWVISVEENDPWVESVFNVKGTGEGLVFYPISDDNLGYANFCNGVFKAKGKKHAVTQAKTPAQVNPEISTSVNAFVDFVLTDARLEQGALSVKQSSLADVPLYDKSNTGKFLNWIATDVLKEAKPELEVSGLDWKQVHPILIDKARKWYLSKK